VQIDKISDGPDAKLHVWALPSVFEERRRDMATIQPKGEKLRQAVKWISAGLQEKAPKPLAKLIEESARQFNLSPKEEEFLVDFYKGTPRKSE
jgi:hypothetical protein